MTKMINNEKEIKKRNGRKPLRVVSKSVKRIDGEDKVKGKTKYGIDYVVPNMYVGKILRSPHAHARIISIDTSRAEALPGVIAVHDSGKAINPQMLKGQIEGGVVMGIGFTLFEEMIYIDGVLQNSNFTDYKIPTTMEMPLINIHLVETEDSEGPYGAKGVGETPVIPVAPAISNAIFDATGVRVKRLPITPERLRKLLSERNTKY